MNNKLKKIAAFALAAAMTCTGAAGLTGCKSSTQTSQDTAAAAAAEQEAEESALSDAALTGSVGVTPQAMDKSQIWNLKLNYINEAYIATGDESLDKYAVSEAKTNKEMTAADGAVYALEQLKTLPQGSAGLSTAVPADFTFGTVTFADGVATVDVKIPEGASFASSGEENLAVGQMVMTIINTFDGVNKVQLLVNGSKADVLTEEVDISNPLGADEVK